MKSARGMWLVVLVVVLVAAILGVMAWQYPETLGLRPAERRLDTSTLVLGAALSVFVLVLLYLVLARSRYTGLIVGRQRGVHP